MAPCLYGDVDGERILVSIASLFPSFILVPLPFSHPPPFVHKLPNDCCLNKSRNLCQLYVNYITFCQLYVNYITFCQLYHLVLLHRLYPEV